MSDADNFSAQDTAHDMCEVNCGRTRSGAECPVMVPPEYCRIEYTLNFETQVDYCKPEDASDHEKTLRLNGAWIHDVSYGKYKERQ